MPVLRIGTGVRRVGRHQTCQQRRRPQVRTI